jgi:cytochrome c553
MMRSMHLAATALAVAAFSTAASAQDANAIKAGARKAIACQTCHGLDGLSRLPDAPNIAGHPVPYLERTLRAFRSGERRNEMMSVVVKTLSDEDIRDLAAYYGAIKVEVRVPE